MEIESGSFERTAQHQLLRYKPDASSANGEGSEIENNGKPYPHLRVKEVLNGISIVLVDLTRIGKDFRTDKIDREGDLRMLTIRHIYEVTRFGFQRVEDL